MRKTKIWALGLTLFLASQTATAQGWDPDEHGNQKVSGSWDFQMYVDCLDEASLESDGMINVHLDWDVTVHTTANRGKGERWMFAANYNTSGYATDALGNEWTWKGHWQSVETSTAQWGLKTDFHNSENFILRSRTASNLILRIQTMIQLRDYEIVVENRSREWFCIQD